MYIYLFYFILKFYCIAKTVMNHIYYILKSSSAKGTERAGSDNWPKVFVQETLLRVKYVYMLLKMFE